MYEGVVKKGTQNMEFLTSMFMSWVIVRPGEYKQQQQL